MSTVTGTSFAGATSYASSPHYRAWGGLQSLSYSNNTVMSMTFDNRLRANHSQLVKNGTTTLMSKDYSFYADGSLRKTDDLVDNKFDRVMTYDNMARPKTSFSGLVARDGTPSGEQWYDVPYVQSYSFNAFGNLTGRDHHHWGLSDYDFTHSYTNNRLQTGSFNLFDADGRQTRVQEMSDLLETTYDAAGRPTFFHRDMGTPKSEITRHYDGDGREAKREKRDFTETEPEEWDWVDEPDGYYIRSTVLGGEVVSEAGSEIAWQNKYGPQEAHEVVVFQNWDAAGMSYMTTHVDGATFTGYGSEGGPAELDPMGGNVSKVNPYIQQVPGEPCMGCGLLDWEEPMFVNGVPRAMIYDGMSVPWSFGAAFWAAEMAVQCPNNDCGPRVAVNRLGQKKLSSPFTAFGDGRSGWMVSNAGAGDDDLVATQQIPECIRQVLAKYFEGVELGNISIHTDGLPWLVKKLNTVDGGAGAFTFGDSIYYKPGSYNPWTVNGLAALAHEVVHVVQYRAKGLQQMATEYFGDYLNNIQGQLNSSRPQAKGVREAITQVRQALGDVVNAGSDPTRFSNVKAFRALSRSIDKLKAAVNSMPDLDLNAAYENTRIERAAYAYGDVVLKDLQKRFPGGMITCGPQAGGRRAWEE